MSEPWFHGSISRQDAEELLLKAGKTDGLFLVRESVTQVGSYALSMCFNNRIIHYHAQRQPDGMVAIEDGPKFPGPVELVHYHSLQLDGLLCKLLKPCLRPSGVRPKTFSGVHQKHIKDAAEKALESMGVVSIMAACITHISIINSLFFRVIFNRRMTQQCKDKWRVLLVKFYIKVNYGSMEISLVKKQNEGCSAVDAQMACFLSEKGKLHLGHLQWDFVTMVVSFTTCLTLMRQDSCQFNLVQNLKT